jgi:hypothetical protein
MQIAKHAYAHAVRFLTIFIAFYKLIIQANNAIGMCYIDGDVGCYIPLL